MEIRLIRVIRVLFWAEIPVHSPPQFAKITVGLSRRGRMIMAANLTPQYLEAEADYKKAQTAEERLACLKKNVFASSQA